MRKAQVPEPSTGDQSMSNATTEQRLVKLEGVLRQIAQLTTQFDRGGAAPEPIRNGGNVHESEPESYFAQGGGRLSMSTGAAAPAATGAFTIEVRFLGGLTQSQRDAFRAAADRWTRVIVGALPAVQVDGELIRIPVPPLSEERRKELVKVAKKHGEDCKVSIRKARHDALDMLEEIKGSGGASEDDVERAKKKAEEIVAEAGQAVDQIIQQKEKEILTL